MTSANLLAVEAVLEPFGYPIVTATSGEAALRLVLARDFVLILSVELGELIMVVYRTKKGADQVLTDYEHEFAHPRPRLAYNESGLLIAGGKYRVETRGIVN